MRKKILLHFLALPILLFFGLCLSANLHAQDFVPDVNAYQSDITVDGSNDDWAGIKSNPTFVDDDSDRKDNWTGPDDCEVTYKVAYGAEMLYLWFDIVDSVAVIYGDDNITEGDGFWEVDNMEICIDVDNSGGESKDELNDFQLRVMRGVDVKPGTSDWLHVLGVIPTVDQTPGSESSVYGTDAHDGLIDGFGFEIAQTETANGWTLEVGIPYSFLTKVDENIAPEDITSGDVLGLAVQYMDRDAFDEVERVALRSNDDHSPGDPSTWGSVTLKDGGETAPILKAPADISINIDGELEPVWYSESIVTNEITNYYIDGFELPGSEEDNSATWKALWSDTAVYLLIEVKDEMLYAPGWPDPDDVIETYFRFADSTFPGSMWNGIDKGYYQVPFKIDGSYPTGIQGGVTSDDYWDHMEYAMVHTETGYVVEASVGWETFKAHGDTAQPVAGDVIPFDILVGDADTLANGTLIGSRAYWQSDAHLYENPWVSAGKMELVDDEPTLPAPLSADVLKLPAGIDISIDGNLDPVWYSSNVVSHSIDREYEGASFYPPKSDEDLSASWKALYNDTAMFLLIDVKDEMLYSPGWPNPDDVIETYFRFADSTFPGSLWNGIANGYYQVPFKIDGSYATGIQGGVTSADYWEHMEYALIETPTGYAVEASIGWETFKAHGETAQPVTGDVIPFDILVGDNDTLADGTMMGSRKYWSSYAHLYENAWEGNAGSITLSADEAMVPEPLAVEIPAIPADLEMVIDGVGDDEVWNSPQVGPFAIEREYMGSSFVSPEDESDLSAYWKAAYNDTAIFLLVEVKDDMLNAPGWPNPDDVIETYFRFADSTFPGSMWNGIDKGYYQVPFKIDGSYPTGIQGGVTSTDYWEHMEYAMVHTESGYVVEASVGWETFKAHGDTAQPVAGDVIPFDIMVGDNDTLNDGTMLGSRKYWSSYAHLYENAWEGNAGSIMLSDDTLITNLITIDGEIDDRWANNTQFDIATVVNPENLAPHDVTDENDLSGYFKVLWEEDYLYVLGVVKDDTLIKTDDGNKTDHLNIYIDPENRKASAPEGEPGLISIGAAYDTDEIKGRIAPGWGNGPEFDFAFKSTEDGYIVEFKIESDSIRIDKYEAGKLIGLDVKINDVDDATNINRDQLAWNDKDDLIWAEAWRYGTIKLLEGGDVEGYTNPDTPENFAVETDAQASTATFTWDAVDNAIGYYLYEDGEMVEDLTATTVTVDITCDELSTFDLASYTTGNVISYHTESEDIIIACPSIDAPAIEGTIDGFSVTLTWDAIDNVTGYKVFQDGDEIADVTETSIEITDLDEGTFVFTVKAYEGDMMSDASNEFSADITVSINNISDASLSIFPNPVVDNIFITSDTHMNSIAVYNIFGTKVMQTIVNEDYVELNVAGLESGLYFLRIKSPNVEYVNKFIKH